MSISGIGGADQSPYIQAAKAEQGNKSSSVGAKLKGIANKVRSFAKSLKFGKSSKADSGKTQSLKNRNIKTSSQIKNTKGMGKAKKLQYTMLTVGLLALGAGVIAGSGGLAIAGAGAALLATAAFIK